MGYYLQAFICKEEDKDQFSNHYNEAISIEIGQNLCLIPMTPDLFDEINDFALSDSICKFEYLTTNIEKEILNRVGNKMFAYVEAEYFGGQGGQAAVIWNKGEREDFAEFGPGKINIVLKKLGVISKSNRDEFDTLGLGRHRNTMDWI